MSKKIIKFLIHRVLPVFLCTFILCLAVFMSRWLEELGMESDAIPCILLTTSFFITSWLSNMIFVKFDNSINIEE